MHVLWIIGFVISVSSCAPVVSTSSPASRQSPPLQPTIPPQTPEKQSPRAIAALQLTEQGRILLEKDNPDLAIRFLERAVNLNPINGQNYYYLSEAWLMKGDIVQAAEFNRLAKIYLEDDDKWLYKAMQQKERINKYKKGAVQ